MKWYRINLEPECRIFKSQNLLVGAMKALPYDARIDKISFGPDGGSIIFHSNHLDYPEGTILNLNVKESIKLELQPKQ